MLYRIATLSLINLSIQAFCRIYYIIVEVFKVILLKVLLNRKFYTNGKIAISQNNTSDDTTIHYWLIGCLTFDTIEIIESIEPLDVYRSCRRCWKMNGFIHSPRLNMYTFQHNKQVKFLARMAPKQAHSCACAIIGGNDHHFAKIYELCRWF